MKQTTKKKTTKQKPAGKQTEARTQPFEIGRAYFLRTVTYHLTGRVVQIIGRFLVLEDAAWIADSGRFADALKTGSLNEVEPVGEAIVNADTIADAFPWKHALPRTQK
jgi:hypothetical protein